MRVEGEPDERERWTAAWEQSSVDKELSTLEHQWFQPWLRLLDQELAPGGRVLEAGCGLGRIVHWMARQGYAGVGLDCSLSALAAAKQRLPEARLVQGDVRRLPFADNSFDACLSFGVIEHFPEGPDATLAEARRVLAPGGKVILSVPHVNWPSRIGNPLKVVYRWLRRLPCTEAPEPPGRYHGRAELRDAFERSGFEIVALLPFDHAYALHSFSGVFRRRDAYHDVTPVGYALARWLRRIAPWGTAFTACVVGRKR